MGPSVLLKVSAEKEKGLHPCFLQYKDVRYVVHLSLLYFTNNTPAEGRFTVKQESLLTINREKIVNIN